VRIDGEGSLILAHAPTRELIEPSELAGLRVLVTHEWLYTWAGAERCVAEMFRVFPNADLVAGVVTREMRSYNEITERARETWLARLPFARHRYRWFVPLQGAAFASLDTSEYDVVISSSHSFAKMVRVSAPTVHVCYCYSPPRYLWGLRDTYRMQATPIQRAALAAGTGALRWLDRRAAAGVDHFIGISQHIAERIRRSYGRVADVVYPPVVPKAVAHRPGARGDFLLHLGRLVPYKRVDLAIAAAERLGVRLIIAGDGPDRGRLQRLAGRHTQLVGQVSETEAAELLSSCAAFVHPAEEDFGIAPLEANAHGAPVIGFGRGSLTETMIAGITAELFEEQSVDAVVDATRRALSREWDTDALRANASRFSPERFREAFTASVLAALQPAPNGNGARAAGGPRTRSV
jgi:glycosyltransferase involved in cell wall biosynthesis